MSENKMKDKIYSFSFYLMLIGGIGGCCVAQNIHNSDYPAKISAISFIPFLIYQAWGLINSKKWSNRRRGVFKLVVIILGLLLGSIATISIKAFMIGVASVGFISYFGYIIFMGMSSVSWTIKKALIGIVVFATIGGLYLLSVYHPSVFLSIVKPLIFAAPIFLYISPGVLIYAYIAKRDLNKSPIFGLKYLNTVCFFGACFIGLLFVLMPGLERALLFIPENWGGYNEDGDWESTRRNFALWFALICDGFIIYWAANAFNKKMTG